MGGCGNRMNTWFPLYKRKSSWVITKCKSFQAFLWLFCNRNHCFCGATLEIFAIFFIFPKSTCRIKKWGNNKQTDIFKELQLVTFHNDQTISLHQVGLRQQCSRRNKYCLLQVGVSCHLNPVFLSFLWKFCNSIKIIH